MSPITPLWGQIKFAFFGLCGLLLGCVLVVCAFIAMPFIAIYEAIMEEE